LEEKDGSEESTSFEEICLAEQFTPLQIHRKPAYKLTFIHLKVLTTFRIPILFSLKHKDGNALLLTAHRILFDERSTRIFFEKLFSHLTGYHGVNNGYQGEVRTICFISSHSLQRIQFADFAHWEANRWKPTPKLSGLELLESPIKIKQPWEETEVKFWKDKLSGSLQVLQIPMDKPRPVTQNFNCRRIQKYSFFMVFCSLI